jgi:dTDP-4-dehydrorhamnose reductase
MRILLTGGSGQVGGELRQTLAPLGEVVAPEHAKLDLAFPDSVVSFVRQAQPDLIVNAAAYTRVERAESEPDLAMKVNGAAPGVLAEEAARCGAALVQFSTDYVFDGRKEAPYREEDPPAPVNVYGKTKYAGEQAVLESPCAHLIFRTSWIYGLSGRNFLLHILQQARAGIRIEVVDDQFGSPTPARSIAEATAQIVGGFMTDGSLDLDRLHEAAGLYHMTAAGRTSWHGFAVEILRERKVDAVVHPVASDNRASAAKRPRNSVLDNARLRACFGVSLPDWRSALSACLREAGSLP